MDNKLARRVAVLTWACAVIPAQAGMDDARAKGLSWLVKTQKGDGSFSGPQGLEVQSTSAAVEAMLSAGLGKAPQHARALAWLGNTPAGSLDARSWQVAALTAAGGDATGIAGAIRDDRNTTVAKSGSLQYIGGANFTMWGAYPGHGASSIDTALGYGALRSAALTYANDTLDMTATTLCIVLPAQLSAAPWTGAWPHALPQNGQPSHASAGSLTATAMMAYELKKQRQAGRFQPIGACGFSSTSSIDTAITNAKTWLAAQTNADGGFAERNLQTGLLETSNPVTTALAIRTLALFAAEGDATATTRVTQARNWLLTQQNTDGSWRGDPFVTARVLAALPAATGAQVADTDGDGLTDVVEQHLGTQTTAADAQSALPTDANALSGITASAFSASGVLGQPFGYSLQSTGVSGSVTFVKTGGVLPPGLSLSPSGRISGTPNQLGSYAFDYEITSGSSVKAVVIGRIDIAAASASTSAPGDSDIPLPAWALAMLGGALLTLVRRRARR